MHVDDAASLVTTEQIAIRSITHFLTPPTGRACAKENRGESLPPFLSLSQWSFGWSVECPVSRMKEAAAAIPTETMEQQQQQEWRWQQQS